MSRVRIYELAKEAGMSSKALADKLVDRGYDIKGHSSTVDDETAARIRNEVFKDSDTEMVEKRISGNQGATVIRRRATVIRRKARTDSEADDFAEESSMDHDVHETIEHAGETGQERFQQQEPEPAVPGKTAEVPSEDKRAQHSAARAKVVYRPEVKAAPAAKETMAPSRAEQAAAAEVSVKTTEVQAKEPAAEEKQTPAMAAPSAESSRSTTSPPAEAEPQVTAAVKDREPHATRVVIPEKQTRFEKKKPKPAAVPQRKGMARIVGSIDLSAGKEEELAEARSRKKPVKPPVAVRKPRPASEPVGGDTASPVSADDASRGKKRGKRSADYISEDRSKRAGKVVKKGGKNVKFTHFGDDYHRGSGKRGKRGRQKDRQLQAAVEMKASKRRIVVYETISVSELASRMRIKASEVIAKLMGLGVMATINQAVDVDTAMLIAADFGYEVEQGITEEIGIQMLEESQEGGEVEARSPVVTVMGHVDHGKTSILDAIRKTDVAEGEAGGITQHIGAYHVRSSAGDVTFVDTPGHAAFTEMRSRGAQVTDLVILVVAADDGVMDQTREAINHAQAANVPILVAVNKIDKANADTDRVKRELSDYGLIPEDWGGQTIYCETSAKKNIGIDELMESIQLMAEMLELKADRKRHAKGRVIEAKLDKGRGAVATVLVQEGTLRGGDNFVVGLHSGKVRAMLDDRGRTIKSAGPSIPVEVQGLSGVPQAGDEFIVVTDEKMAKSVSQVRAMKAREAELGASTKISLDKLFEKMSEGVVQELRVILRADVQGTLEAFAKAAEELSTKDIKVRVLHEGTGTITESDILLASASEAIIIGFNVRPTAKVKELAVKENVDVRSYDVIYHALDDIRKAMVGMLEPTYKEDVIGTAEVRETFSVPKIGTIAGCGVIDGKIQRNAGVRVLRDGVVVYTGKIGSLRRFKDDVKEVATGYECGIGVENFNDIKVGDHLEAFVMLEVEATLE